MEIQYSTNEFIEDVPDIENQINVFESISDRISVSDRTSLSDRTTKAGVLTVFFVKNTGRNAEGVRGNSVERSSNEFTNHKVTPGEKYTQSSSTHPQNESNIHFHGNTFSENPLTRNESLSNVEYYRLMCDIRNMRVLTPQQWGIVRTLSREKLLEIIEVYDLILQNVNYFFE
jgi:hypothetical protein